MPNTEVNRWGHGAGLLQKHTATSPVRNRAHSGAEKAVPSAFPNRVLMDVATVPETSRPTFRSREDPCAGLGFRSMGCRIRVRNSFVAGGTPAVPGESP